MARRLSLLDWGITTVEELNRVLQRLGSEVHWLTKSFGGCPRDVASWLFHGFDRNTPPPADMACVVPLVEALLAVLDAVHADDLVLPIQLYVNRYRSGRHFTRMHSHCCRQATLSLGCERALDVEGPGIPGKKRLRLMPGDCVLLDGQAHGVVEGTLESGVRCSVNLFYCTADDLRPLEAGNASSCRRGRSAVSVQFAAQVARHKDACPRCGFHHPPATSCAGAELDTGWNAGQGVA